jgi:hypothetical protein
MKHIIDAHHAQVLGHLPAAVLFESIQFWVEKNTLNGHNFRDGRYWTYNTRKAFTEMFPYMTTAQLRFASELLHQKDYINLDQKGFDQTLWYTIGDSVPTPEKRLKHIFDPEIAVVTKSIQAAILFENVRHWVHKNKSMDINCIDGEYWTYNTYRGLGKIFPYATSKQIRTAINKLEKMGLIRKEGGINNMGLTMGVNLTKRTYI